MFPVLAAVGAVLATTAGLLAGGPAVSSATERGGDTVSVPVEFPVTLQNRTGLPCVQTPGPRNAVVRGRIVGPKKQVEAGTVAGTLYSHGDGYDANFWSYDRNANYDYTADMARRGKVSVTFDRLGYGRSDKPNGNAVCLGTEADVASQIVGQLRGGTYRGAPATKPRFSRVGLVGHSASGFVVEQEAAAFRDVDALGVISSGELSVTPRVLQRGLEQQQRCLTSPDGYAGLEANAAEFRADHIAPNTEPAIADDLTARRTRDACAGTRNVVQIVAGNPLRNNLIRVPVLVAAGQQDRFFPNANLQAPTYSGSPKVTLKQFPDTGHALLFGRTAPAVRDVLSAWLTENRL